MVDVTGIRPMAVIGVVVESAEVLARSVDGGVVCPSVFGMTDLEDDTQTCVKRLSLGEEVERIISVRGLVFILLYFGYA